MILRGERLQIDFCQEKGNYGNMGRIKLKNMHASCLYLYRSFRPPSEYALGRLPHDTLVFIELYTYDQTNTKRGGNIQQQS